MHQEWHNLLFLHWRIPDALIRPHIPSELSIDYYDGSAWIGIIPFEMRKLRPTLLPAVPPISNFIELNLRTYVQDRQRRKGVWFFSLDTQNPLGNWIARTCFHLNYRYASTQLSKTTLSEGERIHYQIQLPVRGESKQSEESYLWSHGQETFQASKDPDSLDCFLTERYRLFSYNHRKRQLITGTLSHAPYQLNRPDLSAFRTNLFASNGIDFDAQAPDSVLACRQTNVKVYPIQIVP